MGKMAAVPTWAVDVFECFANESGSLYAELSAELISRLSVFVDAYILFDRIVLPSRYRDRPVLKQLDYEAFEFASPQSVTHSDDIWNGITVDLSLALTAFPRIVADDAYWISQHDPMLSGWDDGSIPMGWLRLWQWCATNEMAQVHKAVAIMPNSLKGISDLDTREPNYDRVLDWYREFSQKNASTIVSVLRYASDPYVDTLKCFPPFLTCLIDRARDNADLANVLKTLRTEYAELRTLRERFVRAVMEARTVGEKREVIEDWNASWKVLLDSDFKKPGLLTRDVSAVDVVQGLFNALDPMESLKFLLQKSVEHFDNSEPFVRFNMFCRMSREVNGALFSEVELFRKFGVSSVR